MTKNRRLNELLKYQLGIAKTRYAERVGREFEILVEGEAKNQNLAAGEGRAERVWTGRTGCNRVVNFKDDSARNLTGQFLTVRITGATSLSLVGEIVHDASFAEARDVGLTRAPLVGAPIASPRSSEVVG